MVKKIVLVVFLTACTFTIHVKSETAEDYIVVLFERECVGLLEIENYYWIVSCRQLLNGQMKLFPIYVDGSSSFNRDRCLNGDTIQWYNGQEDDPQYESEINSFLDIVEKNRVLIQTITTQWAVTDTTALESCVSRVPETVRIYAAPIKGRFCNCVENFFIGREKEYEEEVFVPIGDFEPYNDFWDSELTRWILSGNFNLIDFTSATPRGFQFPDRGWNRFY